MTLLFPGTLHQNWLGIVGLILQQPTGSTSCFWEAIANKSHLINCSGKKGTDRCQPIYISAPAALLVGNHHKSIKMFIIRLKTIGPSSSSGG